MELMTLDDLSGAMLINIKDDWVGFSPIAPIQSHYVLEKTEDNFRGQATFAIGGNSSGYNRRIEDINVPSDIMRNFLKTLAKTKLERGEYIPTLIHTDDCPVLTIEITSENGITIFFSSSQGKTRVPWLVTLDDDKYISSSTKPATALRILMPYLKRDVLRIMIDQAR